MSPRSSHPAAPAARAAVGAALALLLALPPARAQQPGAQRVDSVDILIRGGRLVDGTGSAPRLADVAVRGDRIVFVGDAARERLRPRRVIDARGLVVAPGFIDPHAHSAEDLSAGGERAANVAFLMQGVTTVITGNDGHGAVDVGGALSRWAQQGIGTNAAVYIGQGALRRSVMGMSAAAPTPEQLERMRSLVRKAMGDGALGLSTGLYYAPGSFASTAEVVAVARAAADSGGVYDTHMRDESSYTIGLLGSIDETLRIGREANIPVNISHIKALGTDVWGRSDTVIALVRAARARGQRVTADQYPYLASGSSVGASLLPRWAEAGGRDSLLARLSDPATRARVTTEMTENLRRRGGAGSLLITSARGDTSILGKRLDAIAKARGVTPIEAAVSIIQAGDASVASFNMREDDLERFAREPWVMTGSDGSGGHPRKYGSFPRKLRMYVLDKPVLTLPAAIRQSSALAAETFNLPGRGRVVAGAFADVIVFDERTLRDRATYDQPELLAEGMRFVLVNGTVAVADGKYTGAKAGRALRRGK
jgi:N-acyl-D-aspartate/D-glutamate deacylase